MTDWDDKADLLSATRPLYHNEDYWRFLVREVWRLDDRPRRLADFGCGYGWAGLFLMPMLAAGSEYTGLDRSAPLLEKGRALFAQSAPCEARFVLGDATLTPFKDDHFDVAFAHALLMHLPDAKAALAEMIRVTRDGGLVIACDASHNAINALIHVHETEEQDQAPLSLFQAMNADLRRRTGIDHNIGMKTPVLMHQAGLRDVEARVSDAVRLSFPPLDTAGQGSPVHRHPRRRPGRGADGCARLRGGGSLADGERRVARGGRDRTAARDGERLSPPGPRLSHRPAGPDHHQLREGEQGVRGGEASFRTTRAGGPRADGPAGLGADFNAHESPIVAQGLGHLGFGVGGNVEETHGFVQSVRGRHERSRFQDDTPVAEGAGLLHEALKDSVAHALAPQRRRDVDAFDLGDPFAHGAQATHADRALTPSHDVEDADRRRVFAQFVQGAGGVVRDGHSEQIGERNIEPPPYPLGNPIDVVDIESGQNFTVERQIGGSEGQCHLEPQCAARGYRRAAPPLP
jgi:SAM-dependent methyltransferase